MTGPQAVIRRLTDPAGVRLERTGRRVATRPGQVRWVRHHWFVSLISLVVAIGLWQAAVDFFHVSSDLVPAPSQIAARLWSGLQPGGQASFYPDLQTTLTETLAGFAIAVVVGTALALAMAQWHIVERLFAPYVFALNALPKIAIAPFLVLFLNFGTQAMIAVSAATAFFPMMVNALAGFKSVPAEQAMMFRGLCASHLQTFFRLKLRAASPQLLAGIDLALIYAFLGAIVGEFVGGQEGLGVRITAYASAVDVTGEFAVLVLMGAVGLVMHVLLRTLHSRLLFWTSSELARGTNQ
jgi:NitT/TauT family transport system permease protein